MGKGDAIHVSVGAALLAIGAGAILTLLIYEAQSPHTHLWHTAWFLAAFTVAAFLTTTGIYILAALYLPLPLPPTRGERIASPRLQPRDAHVVEAKGSQVIFGLGFYNSGADELENAVVNVVVPDFVSQLERCNERGAALAEGTWSYTPESIAIDDQDRPLPSVYWNGRVTFPGQVSRLIFFRATLSPLQDIPVKLLIMGAGLQKPLAARVTLSVRREAS